MALSLNLACCWVGWLSVVMMFMVVICACWFAVAVDTWYAWWLLCPGFVGCLCFSWVGWLLLYVVFSGLYLVFISLCVICLGLLLFVLRCGLDLVV